jgi:DNA-3-methyladenine glycosylase I
VGATIMYAHMQATGMVNDHLVSCFRYKTLTRANAPLTRPAGDLSRKRER